MVQSGASQAVPAGGGRRGHYGFGRTGEPSYSDARNRAITDLMSSGLNFAEATLWCSQWTPQRDGVWLSERAVQYRDRGFTPTEAYGWWFCWIEPADAVRWANAGWRPEQVRGLRATLEPRQRGAYLWDEAQGLDRDLDGWCGSGLTPPRCLRYAQAGITAAEAPAWEARRAAGEDVDLAVSVLIALQ